MCNLFGHCDRQSSMWERFTFGEIEACLSLLRRGYIAPAFVVHRARRCAQAPIVNPSGHVNAGQLVQRKRAECRGDVVAGVRPVAAYRPAFGAGKGVNVLR